MARVNNLTNFLTDVADAIREKKGTTEPINASEFDTEIASIEGGGGGDVDEYLSNTVPSYSASSASSSFAQIYKTVLKFNEPVKIEGTTCKYLFTYFPFDETRLPKLDTSNVTDMNDMFYYCRSLVDMSNYKFDTSKVTNMAEMFSYCEKMEKTPILDTSKVTNMSYMFNGCKKIAKLPILSNTSKVTTMLNMFNGCSSLIDASDFNYDTSNVTNMSGMFANSVIEKIGLIDCSSVINIFNIFSYVNNLKEVAGFKDLGKAYKSSTSAHNSSYKLAFRTGVSYEHLTEQSMINIMNNLYDIASLGCNIQDVQFGSNNLARLTSEEGLQAKANAEAKGWYIY